MSKVKTIYAVCQPDSTGYNVPKWFFDSRMVAEEYSYGKGPWGCKADVRAYDAIESDGHTYLLYQREPVKVNFTQEDHQNLIKAAKAKLTDEELKLLCLTR